MRKRAYKGRNLGENERVIEVGEERNRKRKRRERESRIERRRRSELGKRTTKGIDEKG